MPAGRTCRSSLCCGLFSPSVRGDTSQTKVLVDWSVRQDDAEDLFVFSDRPLGAHGSKIKKNASFRQKTAILMFAFCGVFHVEEALKSRVGAS